MTVEEIKQAIRKVHEFCKSQKRCVDCPLKWDLANCFCEDEEGETRLPDTWRLNWRDD